MKVEISSVSIIKSSLTPTATFCPVYCLTNVLFFAKAVLRRGKLRACVSCVSSYGGHSQSRQLQDFSGLMAAAPQIRQFT